MGLDTAVTYSFLLYTLFVLLPLIPAVLIFKLFPRVSVSVSGPFSNWTINATGAFAAYLVTATLGFLLVRNIEAQIASTRLYPVEGVVVGMRHGEGLNSDLFFTRYTTDGTEPDSVDLRFVILLDHPIVKPETVWVRYYEANPGAGGGGVGYPPSPKLIPMELRPTKSVQIFRLVTGKEPKLENETSAISASFRDIQIAEKGAR
jgi:hypothetical protein